MAYYRKVDPFPFVPRDPQTLDERAREVFSIQAAGLARRLRGVAKRMGQKELRVALGISGGLDSTLALLVTVRVYELLGWSRSNITTVTMPGYGTSSRTKSNAATLCGLLGTDFREIPIGDIVTKHLRELPAPCLDERKEPCRKCLVCQNAQARERTQILMDIAFTVGTGDLSEISNGCCTFNGDQQSMYNVNAGVPKTLVQHVVAWTANRGLFGENISAVLWDILETPISPELTAADEGKEGGQRTEDLFGPYELHDFFLFHILRNGFSPRKILFLARVANANPEGLDFSKRYSEEELAHWLREFYRRFAIAQFKRNAAPDGPKVGSVALSQRGDWRMPSDVDLRCWTSDLDRP